MRAHYHTHDFIFFVRQRSSDIPIIKEVIEADTYQLEVNPHDIVIDIGSHIGTFAIYAASKGTSVFAYEPVTENFKLLTDNIKINGFPVKAFKMGVSDEVKNATIYIRPFNYGGSNLYSPNNDENWQEQVKCTTLERIFEDNGISECNFLKLDCEGAELEILEGFAKKRDLKMIDKIALEYHGFERRDKLFALLEKSHDLLDDRHNDSFGYARFKRK